MTELALKLQRDFNISFDKAERIAKYIENEKNKIEKGNENINDTTVTVNRKPPPPPPRHPEENKINIIFQGELNVR